MFGIGEMEFIIILLFGFMLFGPDRLPGAGRTIGRALRQFRTAQEDFTKVVRTEFVDPMNSKIEGDDDTPSIEDDLDAAEAAAEAGADDADLDLDADLDTDAEAPAPKKKESFAERKARLAAERAAAAEKAADKPAAKADEPADEGSWHRTEIDSDDDIDVGDPQLTGKRTAADLYAAPKKAPAKKASAKKTAVAKKTAAKKAAPKKAAAKKAAPKKSGKEAGNDQA